MIKTTGSNLHWNYFLALERDLENTSRYIEFCEANLGVFSIELAHLLLAAASEVDVLAKCCCKISTPKKRSKNIDDYRRDITSEEARPIEDASLFYGGPPEVAKLCELEVRVPRYGLACVPWENWAEDKNPDWWRSYNNVKHERDSHFHEATLQNAINALGALLIMNYHHQRLVITADKPRVRWQTTKRSVTRYLQPHSTFIRLPEDYYETHIERMLGGF